MDRPGLRDEGDQPDVAAARRALERKLLPHPGQQFRPGNPRGVVRAGLCLVRGTLTPALSQRERGRRRGIPPLADVPDRQRRDGPPELVVRARPRWRLCVWAARSGCGRSGRLGRGARRASPLRTESDAGHMAAPWRPAATSGDGPRRRPSTRSCRRTSRAGSSGEKPVSGPCRDTSRTNSAAISSAGSLASASPARSACRAARDSSWRPG
jgi:hypothetical protein